MEIDEWIYRDVSYLRKKGDRLILKRLKIEYRRKLEIDKKTPNMNQLIARDIYDLRCNSDVVICNRQHRSHSEKLEYYADYLNKNRERCNATKRRIAQESRDLGVRTLSKYLEETEYLEEI